MLAKSGDLPDQADHFAVGFGKSSWPIDLVCFENLLLRLSGRDLVPAAGALPLADDVVGLELVESVGDAGVTAAERAGRSCVRSHGLWKGRRPVRVLLSTHNGAKDLA